MAYRNQTTFPRHNTSTLQGEKEQITLGHNMEKRHNVLVTKLPRWGNKGATVEIVRTYLNKLLGVNFNSNHIRYALEGLVKHDVVGKRGNGDEATYFARPSTAPRWAKVRVILRGKK